MASQKEYTMLFALNASLQSGFQTTFGKAQQSVVALQKDINALAKQQSDISAYEKQQKAVENTDKKLELLRQQYDNIQKEIEETGTYSSDLENKLLAKQHQIDKTSDALAGQTQKLENMDQALREAGVNTDDLTGESKRLETEMGKLRTEQEKAADSVKDFGDRAAEAMSAVSSAILAAGIVDKLKEIGTAYLETVKTAGAFEKSMSQVAATMGVGNEAVSEQAEFAKQMGATTAFTAIQAAEGMNILAMAGLNAKDQMAGLPTVLDLAAAGGMDLAESASYISGAVKGFGDDMGNARYYADLMAKGATLANTNVRGLGEAFSVSAATARSYGQEADSLTLTLLRLAEQNMTGSEAGRGLMQVMKSIYAPVKKGKDALNELGIAVYDETGKARELNDVVDDINAALSNYSEEQANAIKTSIFSSRSLNAFNMICASSAERVEELWQGIGQANGSAAKQASTQLDNMNGELTIMQSAAEGLSISLGELYKDDMRGLYKTGTDLLTVLNKFVKANPGLVKGVIASGGAFLGMTTSIVGAAAAIKALTTAGTMLFGGAGAAGILAVAGAFSVFAGVAMDAYEHSDAKAIKDMTEEARDLQSALDSLNGTFEETTQSNQATASTAQMYIDRLRELEAVGEMDEEQKKQYHNTLALLVQTMPELADKIDLVNDSIVGGIPGLEKSVDDWKSYAEQQAKMSYLTDLRQEVVEATSEVFKNEQKLTDAQNRHRKAVENQQAAYQQLLKALGMTDEQFRSTYGTVDHVLALRNVSQEVIKARAEYVMFDTEVMTTQREMDNLTVAIASGNAAVTTANDALKDFEESIRDTGDGASDLADKQDEIRQQTEMVTDVVSGAINEINELKASYEETYEAAYKSISGQYALWDDVKKVAATSVDDINQKIEKQAKYWEDYNANLEALRARTGEIEGLGEVISSFADGSAESVNAIAGMARALEKNPDKLKTMVDNYNSLKQAQQDASESITSIAGDFDQKTQEIADSVRDMVSNMDLSSEAKAAALATITGYIEQAEEMTDTVRSAYRAVAYSAVNGMYSAGVQPRVIESDGYASGTMNATAGLHWVGENGPELLRFRGGEAVYPADESAMIADGKALAAPASGNANNVFDIHFEIQGNATPETVAQLDTYSEELAERIIDRLREEEDDRQRRRYA